MGFPRKALASSPSSSASSRTTNYQIRRIVDRPLTTPRQQKRNDWLTTLADRELYAHFQPVILDHQTILDCTFIDVVFKIRVADEFALQSRYFLPPTFVFGIFPQDAPFRTQILNLDLETKTISKGNFPLDCS